MPSRLRVPVCCMLALLLALVARTIAADSGPKLLKLEYTYKFRTIRELVGFRVATFVAHFDRNLSLAGQPVGNYTYEMGDSSFPTICMSKEICTKLPLVTKLLMGAATMTCLGSQNETITIDSLWTSGAATQNSWPQNSRMPSFLVPMGGVQDAVSALHHSLNVVKTSSLVRSSRSISFLLFLEISSTFGPVVLRSSVITLDSLSTCSLQFNGTNAQLTSAGQPVVLDSRASAVRAQRHYLPCTYVDAQRTSGILKASLEALNISLSSSLNRAPWVFAALVTSDSLWGCIEQAKKPVPARQASRPYTTQSMTPLCPYDQSSPQWSLDQCCNEKLSYTKCCRPRQWSQAYELYSLDAVPDSAVPAQCRFRDQVASAVVSFASLVNAAEDPLIGCSADAARNVNDVKTYEMTSFPDNCDNAIFPGGNTPTKTSDPLGKLKGTPCNDSSDCMPGVSCVNFACRPAIFTSEYEEIFVKCVLRTMPMIVKRLFQIRFGLPANQTSEEFRASFESLMYSENCIGGWQAYIYNRPSGIAYAIANRTLCEQHTECAQTKYLTGVTTKECPDVTADGRTGFCATCPWGGYPCLDQFKEPAGCYQWLPNGNDPSCAKNGGTYFPSKSGCWLPNVTIAQCMPTNVCPKYVTTPDTNRDIDGCINSLCYSPQLNTSTCNSTALLVCKSSRDSCFVPFQWSPTHNSGKGLCLHPRLTKAQCPGSWKEAMFWYQGTANTPEKCSAGVCIFDDGLAPLVNRTECLQSFKCSRKCRGCSGRNQAYLAACTAVLSTANCSKAGGVTDFSGGTGLCVFDLGKAACIAANRTYSKCSDLTVAECALCDATKTDLSGCPASKMTLLPSKLLGCGVPETPTFDCLTPSECAATGTCENLFTNSALSSNTCTPDRQGFFTDARCNGACVLPFVLTSSGQPSCAQNQNATMFKNGCHSKYYATQADCEKAKFTWMTLPQTEALCSASSGYGCYERAKMITLQPVMKNLTECAACAPTLPIASIYRPVAAWTPGVWKGGRIVKEDWEWRPRGPIKTLRWGLTLDRSRLKSVLEDISASRNGPFVKSELLCRYSPLASAVTPISCSCDPGGPSKCFSGTVSVLPVGAQRFCAGIGDSVRMGSIFLRVAVDTVPDDAGCLDFGVGLTTSRQFVRNVASLSSTDISSLTVGGVFSVLKNDFGSTVGQLLSDGAQLSWAGMLNSPITVCLDADRGIPLESDSFSELDFAMMQASSAVASSAIFTPMDMVVTRSSEGLHCLSTRQEGTYFLIRRAKSWRDVRSKTTSLPLAIRTFLIINSVAFALLCFFALGSLGLAIFYSPGKWYFVSPQKIILFLVCLFSVLRCVWLALNAAEATFLASGIGPSVLSELPIFTSYSIFTTLIVFWMSSVNSATSGRQHSLKQLAVPMLSLNSLLYIFYMAMLISFSFASLPDEKLRISIAYKGVLAGFSVLTVIGFWASGTRLLLMLKRGEDRQRRSQRIHMTVVTSVSSLCLVGQVAFLLAGASVSEEQQQTFAWVLVFMFYSLFELLPLSILTHMLFGNAWRYHSRAKVTKILSGSSRVDVSDPGKAQPVMNRPTWTPITMTNPSEFSVDDE